ncbi:MAG: AMP-binding protein [Prevotella sp.]|nr:AMP-binding protein [Prevotella sp.]
MNSFNSYIEKSIVDNWDKDALTDYQGVTYQFHDVARKIEKVHIILEYSGVKKGDKIAICGRNSSHWAVAFFAVLTYGAVAVPVLHEFNEEQIYNIVNHSESKMLFVGDIVVKSIDASQMPALEGIINLPDFSIHTSRSEKLDYAREHLNELFGRRYPRAFRKEDVHYHVDSPEELALINYTSGTTGFSKGVMLPYRALWSNLDFCFNAIGTKVAPGSNMLSTLPMAHMYGMAIEFIFGFCHGMHIYFLNRLPSPAIIAKAFSDVKPSIVIAVPLVVEKIVRKAIFPIVQTSKMKLLLSMPMVNKKVRERICEYTMKAFGGNAYEVVVGGAPLNQEVEQFLRGIGFPITMGYGATECAPLITFSDHNDFVSGSCGTPVSNMEVKILSSDPENIAGEIITRGINVMQGYYKNPQATEQALDKDGWYHTGDLGTMSADGHLFIRGRLKNMLLGASGQNIYPEEIEDKLNSMPMVIESIVLQKDNKLVALVHPDLEEAEKIGLNENDIMDIMEQNRTELNGILPPFSRIAQIKLHNEEFAKTPKKSIKRYLYKDKI